MAHVSYLALDVLRQLQRGPVWDGNLISKSGRNELVQAGYANRGNGMNSLTSKGWRALALLLQSAERGASVA